MLARHHPSLILCFRFPLNFFFYCYISHVTKAVPVSGRKIGR